MVIDTSALVAILLGEPEQLAFNAKIDADPAPLISAASYFEAAVVIDAKLGYAGRRDLRLFIVEAEIEVIAVTFEQAEAASEAYRRYGRRNHPAGLNFGDCFAYALAKITGERLLFKGNDFAKTDIAPAE